MQNKTILKGFVVNVENSLNFDIDIFANNRTFLNKAKNGEYGYEENGNKLIGTMYACRLKGVKSRDNVKYSEKFYNQKETLYKIITMVEKHNGWINIETHNIDKHSRLIISIYSLDGHNFSDVVLKDIDNFEIFGF